MEYKLDNFTIYVEDDSINMGKRAAQVIAEQINNKPNTVMGFATGGTPVETYKQLINLNKNGDVDFSKVISFNLDEYYPIKKSNDQSYDYFMKENLFNHININHNNLNIPNGEVADPLKECDDYENLIRKSGGIDFQILGIGLNGHIGFNEPDNKFAKTTQYTDLTESTIEANARFFANKNDVPKKAISMGIKTIMMANKILLLANGINKAQIIFDTIFGDIVPSVPASALQLHRNVVFVLDKEAASKIIEKL